MDRVALTAGQAVAGSNAYKLASPKKGWGLAAGGDPRVPARLPGSRAKDLGLRRDAGCREAAKEALEVFLRSGTI